MKKRFWDTTLGKLLEKAIPIILSIVVKKAPFIKTDQDRKNVDDIINPS